MTFKPFAGDRAEVRPHLAVPTMPASIMKTLIERKVVDAIGVITKVWPVKRETVRDV